MGKTSISWTDFSSNALKVKRRSDGKKGWICRKINPRCLNCYSSTQNVNCGSNPGRHGTGHHFKLSSFSDVEPWLNEKELEKIARARKPRKWFVCDMTDVGLSVYRCEVCHQAFESLALASGEEIESHRADCPICGINGLARAPLLFWPSVWIQRCLDAWYRAALNGQTIQILTKRPQRLDSEIRAWYAAHPLAPNPVPGWWLGTSVGAAEDRPLIDVLRTIPAQVRFLSAEPITDDLGKLDLTGISQLIIGSESGRGARPMETEWAESARDQALEQGAKVWTKQFSTDSGKKITDPQYWPGGPAAWPQQFPESP